MNLTETQENYLAYLNDLRNGLVIDGYPLAIAELTRLYRDKELTLKVVEPIKYPQYALESILIGFPQQSLIVAVEADGTWKIIGGGELLDIIFKFMGVDNEELSFKLKIGENKEETLSYKDLPENVRLNFIKTKFDMKIVKKIKGYPV